MTVPLSVERYSGVERRQLHRARAFLSGKIIIDNGRVSPDCLIRNLSVHGAHINISASLELPRAVGLMLIKEGLLFDATVVWRQGDKTGLVFHGQHNLLDADDPASRAVRALWEELRPGRTSGV